MSDQDEIAYVNTDRELFREVEGDYYSPSIHVTEQGSIGINVGGLVRVMPLKAWHDLAEGRMDWHKSGEGPTPPKEQE